MGIDSIIRNFQKLRSTWRTELAASLHASEKLIESIPKERLSMRNIDTKGKGLPEYSNNTGQIKEDGPASIGGFPRLGPGTQFTGNDSGELFASFDLQTSTESFDVLPTDNGKASLFAQSVDKANMAGRGKGAGSDNLFGIGAEDAKKVKNIVFDDLRLRLITIMCAR